MTTRTEPSPDIVKLAIRAARSSTCAKSQRGAIVYDTRDLVALGIGSNGQPEPYACDGSAACREHCNKLCMHAEGRALASITFGSLRHCELVHAKVVSGKLVAGGGPSCWQCSRQILDLHLLGVWLFETLTRTGCPDLDPSWPGPDGAPRGPVLCVSHPNCACGKRDAAGRWRFYTAFEFHEATLRACNLHNSTATKGPIP